MSDGPIAVWDFTLPKRSLTVGDVHALLRCHCKAYTFQLERGDTTGYEHYQGRLSLHKKKRLSDTVACFPDTGIHISPTCNNARKGPAFYCMKEDTRLEGPWTEKDYKEPKVLTKQLQLSGIMESRYPWQQELMERLEHFDMRTIHMVICKKGAEGKSLFAEYMEHIDAAFEVPPFSCMEDIMQCVMGVPPYKTYIIDLPRALPKDRMASFFAGIESLKNGVMYDKRYHFKKRRIDRPCIVVFSNKEPNKHYLSLDRWRFWTITKDKRLIVYNCDHKKPEDDVQEEARTGCEEVLQEEEDGSRLSGQEECSSSSHSGSDQEDEQENE